MNHEPDAREQVGRYTVDLWRGILCDEVRVWVDVRPALGGLIGRRVCRRGRGVKLHRQTVAALQAMVSA